VCTVILLLFFLWLAIAFGRAFYIEVRRTTWSLLETLIAVNILGHPIAWSIAWSLSNESPWFMDRATSVCGCAVAGLTVSACMAGGAVWVFRRLKVKGETRTGVRLGYMLLGLFLFPSMLAVIVLAFWGLLGMAVCLVIAWIVWRPLYRLHRETELELVKQQLAGAKQPRPARAADDGKQPDDAQDSESARQ